MDKHSEKADRSRQLPEQIRPKEQRKAKARRNSDRGIWFGLGMFGLVGWSVAVPTLIGVALGIWVDRFWPGPRSWTLMGLVVGVAVGCLNAWFWVSRESRHD